MTPAPSSRRASWVALVAAALFFVVAAVSWRIEHEPRWYLAAAGVLLAGAGALAGARAGSRRALGLGLALLIASGALTAALVASAQLQAIDDLIGGTPSPWEKTRKKGCSGGARANSLSRTQALVPSSLRSAWASRLPSFLGAVRFGAVRLGASRP